MGRVFAMADLHGMFELYQQIKDFLEPDDKVYCLGDMGDRGTKCWETIKATMNDPQFKCLKGNHEDLLIKAMKVWFRVPEDEKEYFWYSKEANLLRYNGGKKTLEGWVKESPSKRSKWYRCIQELPTHFEYKNKDGKWIYMSHAGFTPYDYNIFPKEQDLIWDRDHYLYGWPYDAPDDIIIIHGHTPIPYIVDDLHRFSHGPYDFPNLPCAYWYAENHKCCIDNGAFYYNCIVLLDLDTFEEHKFYTADYNPELKWN